MSATPLSDFLAAFFRDEPIHLRTFAPKKAPADSPRFTAHKIVTSRHALSTDAALQEQLRWLNETRGLYFVVNAGGDEDKDIVHFNAWFAEDDARSIDEQHKALDGAPLQPSIRVETRQSVHAYWLIDRERDEAATRDEAGFRDVQCRLIAHFGGDEKIKNPSRVMRLPFFNHVHYDKATGELSYKRVVLVEFAPERRYTLAEMQAAFAPVREPEPSREATADSASHHASKYASWDALHEEAKRRIRQSTGAQHERNGAWHAPGICHGSTAGKGQYITPEGAYGCHDCTTAQVRASHGLPARPDTPEPDSSAASQAGQNGHASPTPSRWFAEKFPLLADEFGDAILEETNKHGGVSARDIGEDFLAATLSDKGSPDAPTVFISTEQRFFTYSPDDGIFVFQRAPIYLAHLSRLLLQCARACRGNGCETRTLEFRFRDSAKLSGVLRKARGLLEAPSDFFSTDLTEFIPCNNGMLRLSDKALLPFSPSYRRRNKLAVPFDAHATCPVFLETLMRPALEPDDLDLLQRWCGLMLIGENLAQKLLIQIGTPGGGKGTFVRVASGIIGQNNLASLRPQLLGERFEIGRFLGKTLLYGADVPENFLNQRGASVLKSLTGYDPMTLEFKNSNESPFIICRFNVIVTCNSRLTVHLEGDTDAWRRRLAIIDYHKPQPAHVIADLDQRILQTEASGVLNWMLEGLDKLRADGWQLHLSAAQQESVDHLLLESDGHTLFVKEALVRSCAQLTVPDCFAAYVEYCSDRGWVALSRNKFGQMIGDTVARCYGLTVRHDITDATGKAQRGWHGLSIREKNPQPTGKGMSEVSERVVSDTSDTRFSVGCVILQDHQESQIVSEPLTDEEAELAAQFEYYGASREEADASARRMLQDVPF